MTVYIIRHGESLANAHKDLPLRDGYAGIADADVPLTRWGHNQAEEAGRFLREELMATHYEGRRIKVLHSPFLRAEQTTDALLRGLNDMPVERKSSPLLQEQDFGLFSCITDRRVTARLWPEEHARFIRDRRENRHHAKAPGGESRAEVVERIREFVKRHEADFTDPNTDVIIVGHGVVNRALELCLRGLDIEWLRKEPNPSNCAIRKLEGDLKHGYAAQYIHEGALRPKHLPKDYQVAPYGVEAAMGL